jgi:hypothetical protein
MRIIQFTLLMVVSGCVMAADLIGSEIPPYPDNLKEVLGACVGGPPSTPDICDYSIGVLEGPKGTLLYLYAGKFLRHGDKGIPYWLITDVMPYPKFPKGYRVVVSTCRQNGVDDRTIVAVVKVVDEEWYKDVTLAYKLDLKQQKFVSLKPKGIVCLNEGWGV